jgi:WD40 repeat protein
MKFCPKKGSWLDENVLITNLFVGRANGLLELESGDLLVFGPGDSLSIWSVQTGYVIRTLNTADYIRSTALTTPGHVACAHEYGKISILNINTGFSHLSLPSLDDDGVSELLFLSNNNLASLVDRIAVRIWSLEEGELVATFPIEGVYSIVCLNCLVQSSPSDT